MFRAILALTLLATPAAAYTARNGVTVIGNADQIAVQSSAGQSASQSWCAAGDFVVEVLGLPPNTPLYRVSPPPRRAGEGVVFSLSAAGATDQTGLVQIGVNDNSVTAAHARSLCWTGSKLP